MTKAAFWYIPETRSLPLDGSWKEKCISYGKISGEIAHSWRAFPTIVCYLDLRQILQPQAMQHPALCMIACRLLQSFANRNLTLTRKIAHITCRSTRDKLLSYLSSCAQDAGSAIFSIPFDRQQLADYLSVERSAMSAELSRMKKDGLIDYHKNQFRLFDN